MGLRPLTPLRFARNGHGTVMYGESFYRTNCERFAFTRATGSGRWEVMSVSDEAFTEWGMWLDVCGINSHQMSFVTRRQAATVLYAQLAVEDLLECERPADSVVDRWLARKHDTT